MSARLTKSSISCPDLRVLRATCGTAGLFAPLFLHGHHHANQCICALLQVITTLVPSQKPKPSYDPVSIPLLSAFSFCVTMVLPACQHARGLVPVRQRPLPRSRSSNVHPATAYSDRTLKKANNEPTATGPPVHQAHCSTPSPITDQPRPSWYVYNARRPSVHSSISLSPSSCPVQFTTQSLTRLTLQHTTAR